MATPYWSNFVPNSTFYLVLSVSIEHLRRVWDADRGRLLLRTPGPVPLGLAYVLLVETCPFSELCSSNIPQYFLDFAFNSHLSFTVSLQLDNSSFNEDGFIFNNGYLRFSYFLRHSRQCFSQFCDVKWMKLLVKKVLNFCRAP